VVKFEGLDVVILSVVTMFSVVVSASPVVIASSVVGLIVVG
jgi:hypothetical protein